MRPPKPSRLVPKRAHMCRACDAVLHSVCAARNAQNQCSWGAPAIGSSPPAEAHRLLPLKPAVLMCPPGYEGSNCSTLCAAGKYSPGGTLTNPKPACLACANGTTSAAGAGSINGCVGEFLLRGCLRRWRGQQRWQGSFHLQKEGSARSLACEK